MTRDETLALFLECEAKRSQVRAAALAEGRNEDEAREIAHEAAKAHWNAWADRMLTEKKALEIAGDWAVWSSLETRYRTQELRNPRLDDFSKG